MNEYVETTGQAVLIEQVAAYRVDLEVSVRAASAESAQGELKALREDCIRTLLAPGLLRSDELGEGGNAQWNPWFWRKKAGQEISYKILISCPETKRLYKALDALQPLFENPRHTLSVAMKTPTFDAQAEETAAAQARAIADARRKAEIVAAEAAIGLGPVVQIEELPTIQGRSGMYGDEEWRGVAVAAAGSARSAESADYQELEGAKRKSTLRYKVRFAIV